MKKGKKMMQKAKCETGKQKCGQNVVVYIKLKYVRLHFHMEVTIWQVWKRVKKNKCDLKEKD